jgi:hypothetical protein
MQAAGEGQGAAWGEDGANKTQERMLRLRSDRKFSGKKW